MSYVFRKVMVLIRPYMKQQVLGLILTLLFSLAAMAMPLISSWMIDEVAMPSVDMPAGEGYDLLVLGILFFVAAALTQPVVGVLREVLFMRITEKVTRSMRNNMFSKMLYSNFRFLNKLKGGDLISIITNDGRAASDFISVIFVSIFANVVMLVCIVVGMLMQSFRLTLIVMAVFGVYFLFNAFYTRRLQRMSLDIQENYDALCTCIDQTNSSILSTKTYNQEKNAESRFEAITDKMFRNNCRIGFNEIMLSYLAHAITMICLGILYGGGILFVMNGTMTLGQVFALGQFFMMLNEPVSALLEVSVSANVIMPIFERIEGYTELETENVGEFEGILRFPYIMIQDLSFSYSDENDGSYALKDITMKLPARGLVNIIGESGSGKTTFTKVMLGLYPVERGMISFGNRDVNDISIATLRGNIGYVPQESEILNDSVFNNIRFGDPDIWLDEAMEVCNMLRLHEKIMSLPSNYRSVITERVNLSGGEKQRILIARAILKEAPIIIMDEPLSALDAENSELVSRIIMRLAEEKLVLMITHYECESLRPVMKVVFNHGEATVMREQKNQRLSILDLRRDL
ncbi:MAG: ABC transporter ATP-binding protein/permease [Peptococcaceae bacterium]|nr:ABC transporter ATP-binding protein/permease [Peptococcaceae bacterium]